MKTTDRACPDHEVLQEVAAGIGSPELVEQIQQHVSRCSICAPMFRRYLREFSDEVSPENARILEQLKSAKLEWQRRLVRKAIGRPGRGTWLKIVPAFAVLAVAIFAVVMGPSLLAQFKISKAKKLVVTAFADRRTTEMKLTAVPYSRYNPFTTQLGGSDGRGLDAIPPEIASAISAANENLKNNESNPQWLQIQGRALLWDSAPGNLEKAEKDFERARSEGLDTPSLDIDLAASYYERDIRNAHPNLQRTLNLLNEVLSKPKLSEEDRASALYSLAIALEKSEQWDQAESAWEDYLKEDSSSGWAEEARRHLKDAKSKASEKKRQSYADPSFFLQQLAQGSLKPEDPEQYQQEAFSRWLPSVIGDKDSRESQALHGLAQIFAEHKHQDLWWSDFLEAVKPRDAEAIKDLSRAMQNNDEGRHDEALVQARRADLVFRHNQNVPAEMLAEFAEIYALRSKLQGATCLARASPLWNKLSTTQYHWLQAQVLLEEAQCQNFQVEPAEADHDSTASSDLTKKFSLPVQELRVIGITAGIKHQQEKCDESWNLAQKGLGLYWQGSYPLERLDQYYAVIWQCARETGALYLAEAVLRHTLALREAPNSPMRRNKIREGMLHLRLANILLALRETKAAAIENQKASAVLKGTDQVYVKDYLLRAKIEPAELQLQHGDAGLALATLRPVEQLLGSIQDKFIVLSYYRALGNIYWSLRQLEEASAAYQSAITLAESSLASLKEGSDRLAWLRVADDSYRGSIRVMLQQGKTEQALERWEWYQSRPLLQGLATNTSSRGRVLSNPEKTKPRTESVSIARLVYASFKDGVQVWVSTRKGITGFWVPVDQQEFVRTVRAFVEDCANPDSSLKNLNQQGTQLYLALLQPMIGNLSGSETVLVELDRFAYNLPVEALRSPEGWYFGEKYPIIYSPGAQAERSLRKYEPITPQNPVMVLDASRGRESGYLPGIDAQRKAIASLFPHSRVFDSVSATWSDVRSSLPEFTVFHFMGHGRPEGSGTALVFNAEHVLSAKDLDPEAFRNTTLAVLAACSTSKGEENGLWDSNNLVRALLGAGVPHVVASHWNVDSETTSKLMIHFYEYLNSGMSAEQAAYFARKQILANMEHPYYWAGFSITGGVD